MRRDGRRATVRLTGADPRPFLAALATNVAPWVRGPQAWRWPYAIPGTYRRLWLPAVLLLAYIRLTGFTGGLEWGVPTLAIALGYWFLLDRWRKREGDDVVVAALTIASQTARGKAGRPSSFLKFKRRIQSNATAGTAGSITRIFMKWFTKMP